MTWEWIVVVLVLMAGVGRILWVVTRPPQQVRARPEHCEVCRFWVSENGSLGECRLEPRVVQTPQHHWCSRGERK